MEFLIGFIVGVFITLWFVSAIAKGVTKRKGLTTAIAGWLFQKSVNRKDNE